MEEQRARRLPAGLYENRADRAALRFIIYRLLEYRTIPPADRQLPVPVVEERRGHGDADDRVEDTGALVPDRLFPAEQHGQHVERLDGEVLRSGGGECEPVEGLGGGESVRGVDHERAIGFVPEGHFERYDSAVGKAEAESLLDLIPIRDEICRYRNAGGGRVRRRPVPERRSARRPRPAGNQGEQRQDEHDIAFVHLISPFNPSSGTARPRGTTSQYPFSVPRKHLFSQKPPER